MTARNNKLIAVTENELTQVEGGSGGPLKAFFYAFFLAYYELKGVAQTLVGPFVPEPKPDPWR